MAPPLVKVKKEKKSRPTVFRRHQHDIKKRVGESWRRPKGIDGRCQRKFKGLPLMPNIGYGTNKNHRHILPNGLAKFRVCNVRDLELLMMHNRSFCAAHSRVAEVMIGKASRKTAKVSL